MHRVPVTARDVRIVPHCAGACLCRAAAVSRPSRFRYRQCLGAGSGQRGARARRNADAPAPWCRGIPSTRVPAGREGAGQPGSPGRAVRPGGRPAGSSSASMASKYVRMGTWAGDPGLVRARAAASSRRVRSSSPGVSVLTSGGRAGLGTGGLLAVVLLGYHLVQGCLQAGADRGDGLLLVEERDGALKLAAVGRQLGRGQRAQRAPGLVLGVSWPGPPAAGAARGRARAAGAGGGEPPAGGAAGRGADAVVASQGAGLVGGRVRDLAGQAGRSGVVVHVRLPPWGRSSRAQTTRSPSLVVSVPQLPGPARASMMSRPWGRSSPGLRCQGPPRSSTSTHR